MFRIGFRSAKQLANKNGQINEEANFNGSIANIAGVFNQNKNILGMMPHPERAIDLEIGLIDGIKMLSI